MSAITLRAILEVTEIKKKTRAKMFKDLKVGDQIIVKVPLTGPGRNRGTYASYTTALNLKTGEAAHKSMNEIDPILDCFEFKEVKE